MLRQCLSAWQVGRQFAWALVGRRANVLTDYIKGGTRCVSCSVLIALSHLVLVHFLFSYNLLLSISPAHGVVRFSIGTENIDGLRFAEHLQLSLLPALVNAEPAPVMLYDNVVSEMPELPCALRPSTRAGLALWAPSPHPRHSHHRARTYEATSFCWST